jgi:putative restriction endonuclease
MLTGALGPSLVRRLVRRRFPAHTLPTTMVRDLDVRLHAFRWLEARVAREGDVLARTDLLAGFEYGGRRVPLVGPQGIFKPALCELPLTITTSPHSPYDDHFVGNRLVYRYRGSDPLHPENVGLRRLMAERVPLIYLHGLVEGRYHVTWPVLVLDDEPASLRFWIQAEAGAVQLGGASITGPLEGAGIADEGARRSYATRLVQQRLHQRRFSERVLLAYREQCSMCRLKHRNLLDAAHIKPDSAGGEPVVPNGLALCKIHHSAFDVGVLGVRPVDHLIQVRPDILEEIDGPMLRHGLQALQGERLVLPRRPALQPDPEMLRWKWERFQQAS